MKNFLEIFFCGKRAIDIELLIKEVPEEFKGDNPWTNYAGSCMNGKMIDNWKWKIPEGAGRRRSLITFFNILLRPGYIPKNFWVAGWALSIMLEEVPKEK